MADDPKTPDSDTPEKKPIKLSGAAKKSDTTRIDLADAKPPPSITDKKDLPPDADEKFSASTMRIDLTPGQPGTDDKSKTSRIEVADAETKTEPPKPAKPATAMKSKPATVEGETIVVAPDTTAGASEEAKKSETARIDLPSDLSGDRPSTKPKTIRIKRSDGTSGRKSLTVSRPPAAEAATKPAPTVSAHPGIEDDDEAGPIEAVVALAATVVAMVLVYLLAAQTIAPNLPFPGKL